MQQKRPQDAKEIAKLRFGMAISDRLAGRQTPFKQASLFQLVNYRLLTSAKRLWIFQLTVCLSTSTSLYQRYSRVWTALCLPARSDTSLSSTPASSCQPSSASDNENGGLMDKELKRVLIIQISLAVLLPAFCACWSFMTLFTTGVPLHSSGTTPSGPPRPSGHAKLVFPAAEQAFWSHFRPPSSVLSTEPLPQQRRVAKV